MYSILLVDDEKSIRDYLPKAIPFERYGFYVKDTAANGREALLKLSVVCPDLILLDIRMPMMDGLQFLKALRDGEYAQTLVVMLSGYSDFTYAKEAMKFDVKAYLNKPVDEDEISPILNKMRLILEQYYIEKKMGSLRQYTKVLNFLYNGGKVDRYQFAGYTLMTCVLMATPLLNESENPHNLMLECLSKYLGETESCQFRTKGSQYTFLLSPKTVEAFANIKDFADKLMIDLKQENLQCSLLFDSYIFDHSEKTFREDFSNHSYEMLTEVFFSSAEILEYHPGRYTMGEELNLDFNYLENIKQHLSQLNKNDVVMDMDRVFDRIEKAHLGIPYIQEISYRIYYLMMDEILSGIHEKKEEPYIERPEWTEYSTFITFEKWKKIQVALLLEGCSFIENGRKMNNMGINSDILNYIHMSYNEQISLKQVADRFFMNAAYLGRAFHKATGVSFKQYVNQIRISEAKRLLRHTDKLIYEIADQVGYTESKYFIVKFTQEVGKSPSEYRHQR